MVFRALGVRGVTHASSPDRENADGAAIAASVGPLHRRRRVTNHQEPRARASIGPSKNSTFAAARSPARPRALRRLIAGVSENSRLLGIGINEDTGLVWRKGTFEVIGAGAVYVIDGSNVSGSNVGDPRAQSAMSVFDLRLHVLSSGDTFDAAARRPVSGHHDGAFAQR